MKHLIVTADDFGLAPEVNDAVEHAHTAGILTTASLMVGAPASAAAVAIAKRRPGLRVGLHLTLLEAPPVLPKAQIPDLVGPNGLFRTDMAKVGADMFFRKDVQRQLAAEIEAQFAVFAATGLRLDHVNAHKHYHLHPTVTTLLMQIGPRYGMRWVRVPDEPNVMVRAIDPAAPRLTPAITTPFTTMLKYRLRVAGFKVPDHVFGLAWSGAMTADRLAALLVHPPQGVTEIYTHPATTGGYPGSAAGYRYADELAALVSDDVRAAARDCGASQGGYMDAPPQI
ncbi:hopanoid biosynthesis-associated protein HpnK [Lichenihabitans sp. Uapishka_5]|uniref:hopanoid biosynthesis-associated protein HpnK n=1 Tax=Lichenihabitans sp. Uapishka_5 TaxID=3037302 RepID=UPI0029E80B05|nr:hopanoid biosynthesis-associated protein HpnK [Lichenihabitans sp. Uapishka_5]MDX7950091.1 hopanoid biosynthesis-associated protein HpnK [Lichenihabitans sp. Uapishka_5]